MEHTARTAAIEVFSDFVCPWCYITERRLRAALRFLTPRIRGWVLWRGLLIGRDAAEQALAQPDTRRFLTEVAAAEGIEFALDRIARVPDTAAAHSLVARVRESGFEVGVVDQLVNGIYRALWSEGRDIEKPATLAELATAVGVDISALQVSDGGTALPVSVSADRRRGAALEIDSIPFVLINDRVGVRGARSTRHYAEAIEGGSWFTSGGGA